MQEFADSVEKPPVVVSGYNDAPVPSALYLETFGTDSLPQRKMHMELTLARSACPCAGILLDSGGENARDPLSQDAGLRRQVNPYRADLAPNGSRVFPRIRRRL